MRQRIRLRFHDKHVGPVRCNTALQFFALANVGFWHQASFRCRAANGGFRMQSGQRSKKRNMTTRRHSKVDVSWKAATDDRDIVDGVEPNL